MSRRFKRTSVWQLRALQERQLKDHEFVALVLDGKAFAADAMVIALGITLLGEKIILGFLQSSEENSKVRAAFLREFLERGLRIDQACWWRSTRIPLMPLAALNGGGLREDCGDGGVLSLLERGGVPRARAAGTLPTQAGSGVRPADLCEGECRFGVGASGTGAAQRICDPQSGGSPRRDLDAALARLRPKSLTASLRSKLVSYGATRVSAA
jgi:hypothetical protein